MNTDKIAVGLDIGTTKIVCVIGKLNEHGKIEILGKGVAKSTGVKGGVVVNIIQTEEAIREAVEIAEENSGFKVKSVVAGIAGKHIRSLQHSDYITRTDRSDDVIEKSDIDELIGNVHKLVMPPAKRSSMSSRRNTRSTAREELKSPSVCMAAGWKRTSTL